MPDPDSTDQRLPRRRVLSKRPMPDWRVSAFDEERLGPDDHAAKGLHAHGALAPVIWLSIAWVCLLLALRAVGYLLPEFQDAANTQGLMARLSALLQATPPDYPSRRAALAFSGVALAVTLALSLAGFFWAFMAARVCAAAYRNKVLGWVLICLVLVFGASYLVVKDLAPFASQFGQVLLQPVASKLEAPWAARVPDLMFVLAFAVPCILLAGACFQLQPMPPPSSRRQWDLQRRRLALRLRELDQMLYIGALALVFGTLQLSAALSVPLSSLPRAVDLKTRVDLCKAMSPSLPASSAFFAGPVAALPDGDLASQCRELPSLFARLDAADGLRRLVRGVTLATGLAFSGLLAAIYVPALLVLRHMGEQRQHMVPTAASKGDIAPVDLFARLGAAVATFGPLFAGLLANMLSGN